MDMMLSMMVGRDKARCGEWMREMMYTMEDGVRIDEDLKELGWVG